MSELQLLLSAYDEQRRRGGACALATVVEVNGSAYRRPGARMLVTEEGQLTGTISGGCLEGDARRRAQQVMHRGKPEIIVYDSTDIDDDLENGAQLGCQGEVHVLLEPIDINDLNNAVELLRGLFRIEQPAVLATILRSDCATVPIAGRLLAQGEDVKGNLNDHAFAGNLMPDARLVLANGQSLCEDYQYHGALVRVFIELIKPAPVLSIYGAGNDARPLAELAVRLGWRVSVLDGRPLQAAPQRFPAGVEAVVVARAEELAKHIRSVGFAVLMSHNYYYDLAVLRQLCFQTEVQYIGILGPRKKTDRMLNDLQKEGVSLNGLETKLYSPIGLDIGSENADEIALSIMAELVAVRNGLQGGFLRNVDAPIHGRNKTSTTIL